MASDAARCSPLSHTSARVASPSSSRSQPPRRGRHPPDRRRARGTTSPRRRARPCPARARRPGAAHRRRCPARWPGSTTAAAGRPVGSAAPRGRSTRTPTRRSASRSSVRSHSGRPARPCRAPSARSMGPRMPVQVDLPAPDHAGQGELEDLAPAARPAKVRRPPSVPGRSCRSATGRSRRPARRWPRTAAHPERIAVERVEVLPGQPRQVLGERGGPGGSPGCRRGAGPGAPGQRHHPGHQPGSSRRMRSRRIDLDIGGQAAGSAWAPRRKTPSKSSPSSSK